MELQATLLRNGRYAVQPKGTLGTTGKLSNGKWWTVSYVNARSESDAIRKARIQHNKLAAGIGEDQW